MTSVGSVSVSLRLDTRHFDRQLTALESRQLKPLAIDAKLDTSAVKRELQALSNTKTNLAINARLDISRLQQDLRTIGAIRILPLPVRAELDANRLRADLRTIGATRIPPLPVRAVLDVTKLRADLRSLPQRSTPLLVPVRLDTAQFNRDLRTLITTAQAQLRSLAAPVAGPRITINTGPAVAAATGLRGQINNILSGIGQGVGQGIYNSVTGAITTSVAALVAFGNKSLDAASKVQNFDIALTTIAGSSQGAARETEVFRKVVDNLSLPLEASRRGFLQLAAAANDTSLEGVGVRNIFDGVSHAISGLNLPAGQADRAFTAISQVMGKGKVTAEEL